jgi:hypothetical protein
LAVPPTYYLNGHLSELEVDAPLYEPSKRWTRLVGVLENKLLPSSAKLLSTLQHMHACTTIMNVHGADRISQDILRTEKSDVLLIVARLFEILCAPMVDDAEPGRVVEKVICLASLFYLNDFRYTLGDCFIFIHRKWVLMLIDHLQMDSEDWFGLEDLRLWCLVQGGIHADFKCGVFFEMIEKDLSARDMNWEEALTVLKEIYWVESLFAAQYESFGSEYRRHHEN